jgi:hypothetical protein
VAMAEKVPMFACKIGPRVLATPPALMEIVGSLID